MTAPEPYVRTGGESLRTGMLILWELFTRTAMGRYGKSYRLCRDGRAWGALDLPVVNRLAVSNVR